ncbi:hypothetical protein MRX96_045971 [Rhipicephalus microplus]
MAPTRWGIVAAGSISNDFVDCLNNLPQDEHQVVAVAGRNFDNAKKFAQLHRIRKVYSSYEEIAADPDVEVAYVGSLHPDHFPTMKMLLAKGKHILCEKPLTMNRRDTEDICRMAKEKKLFLMEALWSRFMPTYKHMEELLQNGTIGEARYLHCTYGSPMDRQGRVFGAERPVKISACGDLTSEGIDQAVAVAMEFSGGRLATFALSGIVNLPGAAEIFGTKGKMTLHPPFIAPTCVDSPAGKFEIQLPQSSVPLNRPNTAGLRYEAEEVRRCLREGLLESPKMTHRDSLLIAEILDEILKQIGVSH